MNSESTPATMDEADDLLEAVAGLLRAQGERMTTPRRAVLQVLTEQPGHLSMDDIAALVAERSPQVHRASVYRTLVALTQLGVVQHVHVGHGATAYHLTDAQGPHLHAQCRSCGGIIDLPAHLFDDVSARVRAESGFVLDPGHVALSGLCADCASGRAAATVTEGHSSPTAGAESPHRH